MMIGTETHADIRHVVFSNIVVRDSNKVFGINVQDGGTVSDVRFQNVTFELNRRHWNWWGSAEVLKFVLKKRTPESRARPDREHHDRRGAGHGAGHVPHRRARRASAEEHHDRGSPREDASREQAGQARHARHGH